MFAADILKTNDALVKVMEDYKAKFGEPGKVEDEAVATAEEATPTTTGRLNGVSGGNVLFRNIVTI